MSRIDATGVADDYIPGSVVEHDDLFGFGEVPVVPVYGTAMANPVA